MITIKELTKNYEEFEALNIPFLEINEGSIFGLVGVNGSSKSTLLRTIAGVYKPNKGNVYINNKMKKLKKISFSSLMILYLLIHYL